MIKKSIVSLCLLLSLVSFAQQGTSSPYSFYGVGDVRFKGTVESRSMAGLAIESDSIHINLQNPAGYSSLRYTTFGMGGTYGSTTLKTDSQKESATRTTLDYLAVGMPVGRFGVGFGLIPYSSVGYKIQSDATDITQSNKRLEGKGGLNKAYLGFGFKVLKGLDFGADVSYNFGKIETNSLEFIPYVPIGTRELNKAELSGVNFNLGLMYQTKITKKLNFYSALNYTPEYTIKSFDTRSIATVQFTELFDITVVDQFSDITANIDLKMPSKVSFGAGVGESKKWFIGAEMKFQDVGSLSNNYNKVSNATYEKYSKYSIGGYYIPDYNSYTSYAKRMIYRGGFKYEKTGLIVNSESINDVGVTLGLGIPFTGSFSNLNLGLEFGQKGTTNANLVQENYFNVSVGFSLNDKWFVRRKFY